MSLCLLLPLVMSQSISTAILGDPMPQGAIARFGSHRFYHGPGLDAVMSPDGKLIATHAHLPSYFHASDKDRDHYNRTIILWNAATGERVRQFRAPQSVGSLAFSSDGKELAVAGSSSVSILDLAGGLPSRSIPGIDSPKELRFSADDKRLLVTEFLTSVKSIDRATGKLLKEWKRPTGPSEWLKANEYICDFEMSPDEKFIVWQVDQKPDTGKLKPGEYVPPHLPRPRAFLVSDMATDKILYRKHLEPHFDNTFDFSWAGRFFFAGEKVATAYDTATGNAEFTLKIPELHRILPSPDGKRAVISSGWSEVRMWDLETKAALFDLSPGLTRMEYSLWRFSRDGRTLLLNLDESFRLFDAKTGKERAIEGHRYPVVPQFSSDGRTLFTTCNEATCSWDLTKRKEGALLARKLKKKWEVLPWDYSADRRLILESSRITLDKPNDQIRVLETETGRVVSTLEKASDTLQGLLTSDGARAMLWNRSFLRAVEPGVRLYDAKTGKKLAEFDPKGVATYQAVVSPDGRYVAWANESHGANLYDTTTGKLAATLQSAKPFSKENCRDAHLLFSPDSEYLILTSYDHPRFCHPDERNRWQASQTRVFHIDSEKEVSRFYANPDKGTKGEKITCAACTKDNRMLAVAEEESGVIRLFDMPTGKFLRQLAGHRHGVRGLAFSPDGKTLASGGEDNVAYLWDVSKTAIRSTK